MEFANILYIECDRRYEFLVYVEIHCTTDVTTTTHDDGGDNNNIGNCSEKYEIDRMQTNRSAKVTRNTQSELFGAIARVPKRKIH